MGDVENSIELIDTILEALGTMQSWDEWDNEWVGDLLYLLSKFARVMNMHANRCTNFCGMKTIDNYPMKDRCSACQAWDAFADLHELVDLKRLKRV